MCGIAGFLTGASDGLARELADVSSAMDACLQHRGPDDHGIWVDAECGLALVHRRLSILDLSAAGHQPMISADGRFVIIYNGEVYSHQPIAAELAERGHHFRGHSDTEVIVNGFAQDGIEPTLKRMIGMFAIALWDRRERSLILIRDRLGIKPLYWAKFGKLFLFGSELKALCAHPGWQVEIDREAVAAYLGTDHTELTVTSNEALDLIPRLPEIYDEPFADSSQIPTYFVSAMTRKHVTVALSGDGGDELFAGYNRYQLTQRFWQTLAVLPRPMRNAAASALTMVRPDRWTALASVLPAPLRPPQMGDKLHKVATVLKLDSADAIYRRLVSHWEPSAIMPGVHEPPSIIEDKTLPPEFPDLLARMQFLDLVTYLPDDILTKVDRASMAVALEARVPLLDHRVVEFSWRLPRSAKVRNHSTKWILRQVLYRHVPRTLIERPKMGFGIPLGEWLRGPLRDWAETLLNENRLRDAALLDHKVVRRFWQEHLDGSRNWQYLLWNVLMLEAWRERWA